MFKCNIARSIFEINQQLTSSVSYGRFSSRRFLFMEVIGPVSFPLPVSKFDTLKVYSHVAMKTKKKFRW